MGLLHAIVNEKVTLEISSSVTLNVVFQLVSLSTLSPSRKKGFHAFNLA